MEKVDFLKPTIDIIRSSVKGIDDSYRNPWDILAELLQNAVDAVNMANVNGKIDLEINAQEKSIRLSDNGCGISKEALPRLLNLFSSGKKEDSSTVGEKGVGLKFVLFQSSYFEIVSSDGATASKAVVRDAKLWKKASHEIPLQLDYEEIPIEDKPTPGTTVFVKGVDDSLDDQDEESTSFFKMCSKQIEFIIRTRTAIGDTRKIWDESLPSIEVTLELTDCNGDREKTAIPNRYWLPTENIADSNIRDIEVYEDWAKKADRIDSDKRAYLNGKVLTLSGEYKHNGYRKINYWICYVPSRRDWDTINVQSGLATKDNLENPTWVESHSYALMQNGIFTATKGMPTGISVEAPPSGNAGYWPNFFMIFQDDALNFDIGRKSIHGNIQKIYKAKAKEFFNKFTKYITRYTCSQPVSTGTGSNFNRYKIQREVDQLINLNSSKVRFIKNPKEQEAAVSAIFFELIGNGSITDITPIYLGYRQKYDLYAYHESQGESDFGFYEFKSRLRNITKDFQDAKKVFDEMDYIVCWDVSDDDVQKLREFGIECSEYEQGDLHPDNIPKCTTHRLSIANVNPIYVIDLKKLV